MHSIKNIIVTFLKLISFGCVCLMMAPGVSFSQNDTADIEEVYPVTVINPLIKYSEATIKNDLNHDGKIYGYTGGASQFINDLRSQETVSFQTGNYDSIQFYYEWDVDDKYRYKVDKFFIKVSDNKPFEFSINPIREISNFNMSVDNSELRKLASEKLYEVIIKDDVDPNNIIVQPTEESARFIDIWKIDSLSVVYQIRLKDKNEFVRNLSEDVIKKWKKGDELSFPIGIILSDKNVPADVMRYTLFLKKEKKPKKRSS